MPTFGSKLGFKAGINVVPETLGSIYQEISREYPNMRIVKPAPGNTYTKRPRPCSDMDLAAFRYLPDEIEIIQPPRLYRSNAWKYNGSFHGECETHWEVEIKYTHQNEARYSWLPIRVLFYAYIPVMKQLNLFD